MIRMAERDIKKYIEPSNKETENIFHSWMRCHVLLFLWFSQCVNVNGCVDVLVSLCACVCVCVYECVLPSQSVQVLLVCLSSLTGLWLWWFLYLHQFGSVHG